MPQRQTKWWGICGESGALMVTIRINAQLHQLLSGWRKIYGLLTCLSVGRLAFNLFEFMQCSIVFQGMVLQGLFKLPISRDKIASFDRSKGHSLVKCVQRCVRCGPL